MKGITVQIVSNLREPAIGRGISYGERRRYFTMNKSSAATISKVKKPVIPIK